MATVCPGISGHAPIDMVVRMFSGEERRSVSHHPGVDVERPVNLPCEVFRLSFGRDAPEVRRLIVLDSGGPGVNRSARSPKGEDERC